MTDHPSHIVFGSNMVTVHPAGARVVVSWAELARRYLNQKDGVSIPPGWRGHADASWLFEQMQLVAEPSPSPEDGSESATAARPFTLVVPSSWPVLTVGEVAELRHVSPNTVRRALREGRLAGKRHRGGWLVPEDQARMWMPGRRNGAAQRAQAGEPGDH